MEIRQLLDAGRVEDTLLEAARFPDGYWPDERYENARDAVREVLFLLGVGWSAPEREGKP